MLPQVGSLTFRKRAPPGKYGLADAFRSIKRIFIMSASVSSGGPELFNALSISKTYKVSRARAGMSCTFLLVVAGALQRACSSFCWLRTCCPPLAVLALRRVGRLASHAATTAKMHNLSLRGPKSGARPLF
jgi:hypothetical protein